MECETIYNKIRLVCFLFVICLLYFHPSPATADQAKTLGCAWAETAGWVNFSPNTGGVKVHDSHLSGYAWSENIGWIKMGVDHSGPYTNDSPEDWGVNKAADGTLSGYAWSETAGWINFSPDTGQATIDDNGAFHCHAWSETVGWISLKCAQSIYGVRAGATALYDFNTDGQVDILYRHPTTGDILVWFMTGTAETSWTSIINSYGNPANHGLDWDIRGAGDFDGDGYNDILFRHSNGNVGVWLMIVANETIWRPLVDIKGRKPSNHGALWDIRGITDFNDDGQVDVLYRHPGMGNIGVWIMDGVTEASWVRITNSDGYPANHGIDWDIRGVGDFNGDGHEDILWRKASQGNIGVWLMNGTNETTWKYVGNHGIDWEIKGVADYNGDGHVDILYRHPEGDIRIGVMNGAAETSWPYISNHDPWDIR